MWQRNVAASHCSQPDVLIGRRRQVRQGVINAVMNGVTDHTRRDHQSSLMHTSNSYSSHAHLDDMVTDARL